MDELKRLEIFAVIGFDGSTKNGIKCHPNGIHIIYPMGNKICIQNWKTKKMNFLVGHSNSITALDMSSDGKYIGSGQINRIGFKSMVILWDFETKVIVAKHEYHMVRVESIVFSCDNSLMISIGGEDCGQICVWNIQTNTALCSVTASKITTGDANTLASLNKRTNTIISGGENNLRVWSIDKSAKFPEVLDISMGKLKRYIICITIHQNDEYGYCGTTSGDIIKIKIDRTNDTDDTLPFQISMIGCLAKCGVWKKNAPRPEIVFYSLGVSCIIILEDETLLVGAGDGTIDHLEDMKWKKPLPKSKIYSPVFPQFKLIKTKKIKGFITSMQIMKNSNKKEDRHCLVGTKSCEIYMINLNIFQVTLVIACHTSAVNEIALPYGFSQVFATGSTGDVRIWCLKTCQELLRIQVANFVCTSLLFSHDGTLIYSGWDDGCIRAFTPLSGKLAFTIVNTHNKGTSALAITSDGKTLVSGGCEGQIRIWNIEPQTQTLKTVLKEHKKPVSAIRINNFDTEAVSAGADGSCIIWDLINLCRLQIIFVNTIISCVCYDPSGSQILTVGTDRRVAYWETGSGSLLRELEASRSGEVNAIHINNSGESFSTGGSDQTIKLWKYQEGIYTHIGLGHSGAIKSIRFTHDGNYIVSASESGDIFIWKCPHEHLGNNSVPSSAKSKKDSARIPVKYTPQKEENISTINTARSSVITNHSCTCKENSSGNRSKQGNDSKSTSCICDKKYKPLLKPNICTPSVSSRD